MQCLDPRVLDPRAVAQGWLPSSLPPLALVYAPRAKVLWARRNLNILTTVALRVTLSVMALPTVKLII